MKNKFLRILFLTFFLSFFIIPWISAEEQSIDEFITRLKKSLDEKDIPAYLSAFSPEIRDREEKAMEAILNNFEADRVSFHRASKAIQEQGQLRVYFQVLYQNEYSALVEMWKLLLSRVEESWQIQKKDVSRKISILYKIRIPSDRIERAASVEINHGDIKLSFKDAVLYYDNIPGLETALLITGKGNLIFSPSDPREQHQLQLIFKKKVLEDNLEYAYLRFSDGFFKKNIKIRKASHEKPIPIVQIDIDRAYALFHKHYSHSFTIESSLDGELLSFLPQGNQAVFEFEGEKTGPLAYIYSPFNPEEISLIDMKEERLINLYSPLQEEGEKRLFISFSQKFDIKNYEIDIDFNPHHSYLSGKASVEVESQVDFLESLKFKFSPELSILRIFDEERNELFYTQDKIRKILYVYLIRSPSQGKTAKIEVYYRGKLVPPKQIADVIPESQYESDKIIVTPITYQSHLFSQSSYWYPSPADVDYFQARLKIIIPPQYTCISNGELKEWGRLDEVKGVEDIEKMGHSVYVFKTKYPVKYLSFIVGKFSKVTEDTGSLPIEVFASSSIRFQNREIIEEVRDILDFYQGLFGSFPYEKLIIVQRLWPLSGGHSPASFIVLNEPPKRMLGIENGLYISKRYLKSDSPVDLSRWKEYFIAHEIAHQWWGQGVTWASYHDQWLSEGLAQFSSILYLREKRSQRIFSHILRKFSKWTEKKSVWGPITMGSRLSYFDFIAYQSIIYNKASLVLNMLKEILGEELFFEGLREFYRTHKYEAARTKDFVKTMEKVTGKDLKLFFDGWFNSYLLPEVKITHSIKKVEDAYLLKFKLNQQKGLFVFPLWIEWKENGQKITKKVIISSKNEEFDFRVKEKPAKIKVNPERAVPGKFS